MKIAWKKNTKLSFALAALMVPTISQATNGLFVIGHGTKSRAMGGVAIATPLDSLSGATNPATISSLDNRFDIGMDIFRPEVESQLGSVKAESEASINGLGLDKIFFMPSLGFIYQLTDDLTFGFTMVAAGGGGTKFTTNFYEAAAAGTPNTPTINETLRVDLAVMQMNPTIAYQLDDNNHVGVSLVIGVARFQATGLSLFDPFTQTQGTIDNFTNQGKDWTGGAGLRVGWLGEYGDFSIGAEYTSEVNMDEFNRYTELFAEHGDLDIPASVGLGLSYKFTPDLLMAFDVIHTFYEDVRSVSNLGPNLAGNPNGPLGSEDRRLGLPNGLGFGWEDQTVYKIGVEYVHSEKLILRAGWNYGETTINEAREIIFNLVSPATTEHHLTLGATYNLNPEMELNFSYIHAFSNELFGPTYISDDGSNLGRMEMEQNSIGGSLSWKF